MRWSTAEVARMSRVSSRTLRHYDHVGLLPPARTGHGGIRFYERPQLLRLQHILVLRELGLGLDDIGAVLDGADEVAALRRHRERLLGEAQRLRTLAATVAATISEREDGPIMAAEELFTGFRDNPYEGEARERWGNAVVDEANSRVAGLGAAAARAVQAEGEVLNRDVAAAMAAGLPVDDVAVQAIVARHHAWVSGFWTPNREAYIGLGRMYVDDERFTATYDAVAPGLAPYLRDAIAVYAQQLLS